MNNFNQPMQMPQARQLTVTLVPDISNVDGYPVNPGASMLFLDESMTTFKMRSRDPNGFPLPERIWKIKEVTPPSSSQLPYATKEEVEAINSKMDQVLAMVKKFVE